MIEISSSLPGALGSAYQRVDEMLSGYTQIPANAAAPRPAAAAVHNGHGGGAMKHSGGGRRGRRTRARNS